MRFPVLSGILAWAAGSGFPQGSAERPDLSDIRSWAAVYAPIPEPMALAAFDLVAIEPAFAPPLAQIRAAGTKVVAYLSLGEINRTRPYWERARDAGILAGRNTRWPDADFVDMRSPAWSRMVLDDLVPPILAAGYDGLLLDTLDDADHLEREGLGGARQAALDIVASLRRRWAGKLLIANGGIALMPGLASSLDAMVVESVWSGFDFGTRSYHRRPAIETDGKLAAIGRLRARTGLPVFPLEYAGEDDAGERARLFREARASGLVPYVATIALDRLVPEVRP